MKEDSGMKERLKELRLALGLKQKDIAEKIGVTPTTISRLEKGEREISRQQQVSICYAFNVNEEWLRTGEGSMFVEIDEEEALAAWFGDLLNPNNEEEYAFTKKFIKMLSKLDKSDWKALEKMAKELAGETK